MANLARSLNTATENENVMFTLKAYWKTFTIATCLQNIQKALQEMKSSTINASWRKLWPEVVYDNKGSMAEKIHHSAVQLASRISEKGFADMTIEKGDELIDCHSKPLNKQDLEAMTKSASKKEEDETQKLANETVEPSGLSLECLAELFGLINYVK